MLVTDKVRRTAKFMCMVAKGIPIVGPGWLSQSKETKTFQGWFWFSYQHSSTFLSGFDVSFLLPFSDPWLHIVADEESERKWGFSLRRTLREAPKTPLLANYKVHATKSVVPPPEQLKGTAVKPSNYSMANVCFLRLSCTFF